MLAYTLYWMFEGACVKYLSLTSGFRHRTQKAAGVVVKPLDPVYFIVGVRLELVAGIFGSRLVSVNHRAAIWELVTKKIPKPHFLGLTLLSPRSVWMAINPRHSDDTRLNVSHCSQCFGEGEPSTHSASIFTPGGVR